MKQKSTISNKGERCPIKSSNFQDVCVIGASIEKNHPDSKIFCAKNYAYYTMNYIMAGYGWATYGGIKTKLCPDMLYVVYPNSDFTIVQDKTNPYTLAWMNLDGTRIKSIMHRIGIDVKNPIIQLKCDERLRNYFKQTPSKCKNNFEKSDLIALNSFYNIINLIFKQTSADDKPASRSDAIASIATQYVKDHYQDPELSVEQISRAINVSQRHLSMTFKKNTGVGLRRFITNCRLAMATELLTEGELSIQEISSRCGFYSPYYFSLVYKKYNAVPPSQTKKDFKSEKRNNQLEEKEIKKQTTEDV